MSSLPDDTKRHLHQTALAQQREGRVPGLAAAVARDGDLLWYAGIGTTEVGSEEAPGPDSLEEMGQPQVLLDTERWNGGMGLGLFVRGTPSGRTWVGHDGGMPGRNTVLLTHRESGIGGVVLMNSSSAPDPAALAVRLADRVVEEVPVQDEPWRPGTSVPEEPAGVTGR